MTSGAWLAVAAPLGATAGRTIALISTSARVRLGEFPEEMLVAPDATQRARGQRFVQVCQSVDAIRDRPQASRWSPYHIGRSGLWQLSRVARRLAMGT
jgi:hypothetical protein